MGVIIMVQGIDQFVEDIMVDYKRLLTSLVRVPSISQTLKISERPEDEEINKVHRAINEQRLSDLDRVVGMVAETARWAGFTTQTITSIPGLPSPVLVTKMEVDPSAPWLMVYNHLDVQPVDPSEWNIENPFEPVDTGEYLLGRGATDDKGPMLATLLPFKHLRDTGQLKVNVIGVYETQEENGSGGFEAALRYGLEQGLISVPDSILASDTIFEGDNPSLTCSLRGLITATVSLQTADQVVHSGLGGGKVMNPLNVLLSALGNCYNPITGKVTFHGIEEGVTEPGGRALEEFLRVAAVFDQIKYLQDLGVGQTYSVSGAAGILNSLWHQPSFEIHDVRRKGEAGTKIPYQAEADISLRLVGKQDPAKVVEYLAAHLKKLHPDIKLNVEHLLHPVETQIDNLFMDFAAAACEYGYERKPAYVGGSGSIGAFSATQKLFPQTPTVMIAMSKASDGYHAPNEKFEWEQARRGMKTMAAYVKSIGELRTK